MNENTAIRSFYLADRRLLFILLCALSFLLLFIKKTFIESETAVFEFLQDKPEGSFFQILNALQYLSIPIIYLWKVTIIAFVIWVGCFMFGYRVTYGQCWSVALCSEYIFLLPETLKIGWFLFVETDPTLYDVKMFYPLSILNLTDIETLDKRYIYPLKALNLFEIIYWSALIFGVHFYARKKISIAGLIVASSYILLFLVWLIFYSIIYN